VLAEANVDVFAYDMHGHGLSEPKHPDGRVCIQSADHLIDDAIDFLDEIVLPAVKTKYTYLVLTDILHLDFMCFCCVGVVLMFFAYLHIKQVVHVAVRHCKGHL
jgi:Serine aminopeptidase, S33